jgi:hypothetical protein
MAYSKPSELLRAIDSHDLVHSERLRQCNFDTECISLITGADAVREIEERGLGGWFNGNPDDWFFRGWSAATDLAYKYLGEDPGAKYQGRGSRFRACLEALEKAGH